MKRKVFIIMPIIILIILLAIVAILYFTTDLFKSNKDLFWKYFAQNKDITEILNNDNQSLQYNFKQNNSYISTGNLSFIRVQGEESSKQFSVDTTSRHDISTGRTYADAVLKNGELDLFKVSYINSDDIYAIKCDEVFPNYVGVQNSGLTQLAINYQLPNAENMPDSIKFNEYINLPEITEEQEEHLKETYLAIIMNNISEDQYTKGNELITINNIGDSTNIYTYNANVYTVNMSGENVKNILLSILDTLRNDTQTLMMISNKLEILGLSAEYTDTANLSAKIGELITKIQSIEIEEDLNISVYEYNNTLIRTNVNIGSRYVAIYDKLAHNETLTIELPRETLINIDKDETREVEDNINLEENTNDIIDLNATTINQDISNSTMRIVIKKNISDALATNEMQIIMDTREAEENINFIANISNIQNDIINNSYMLIINTVNNDKAEVYTISYEDNIQKSNQVEEIEELNSNNTALINNYDVEAFKNFINNWLNIFETKLLEQMSILGFEELSVR